MSELRPLRLKRKNYVESQRGPCRHQHGHRHDCDAAHDQDDQDGRQQQCGQLRHGPRGLARQAEQLVRPESSVGNVDAQRTAAEARRAAAKANSGGEEARAGHDRSAEMRAEHPPNENAAPEAFLAEENALNAELREQRKNMRAENRGDDRGPDEDGGDDD